MTYQDTAATDAQIVTEYAVDALRAGRFNLARALTSLAARITEVPQPIQGYGSSWVANHVEPAPQITPAPPTLRVVLDGPTGNGDRDLARAEAAATAVMARPVPQSDRCAAIDPGAVVPIPCGHPIYLETRDDQGNQVDPFWLHVDPSINTHHDAVPQGPRTFAG